MHLPDYTGGSIVNLMASIESAFGGKPLYPELKALPGEEINARNVILLMVDGLGHEFLRKHGKGSFLANHLKSRMTSVFPSTTASCVTTFITGVAPQQHAITGWFTYLREIDTLSTILRFHPRGRKTESLGLDVKEVFDQQPLSRRLDASCSYLVPQDILESPVSEHFAGASEMAGFDSFSGLLSTAQENTAKDRKKGGKRRFIYAYWPELDSICHKYGTASEEAREEFQMIDQQVEGFTQSLGKETMLLLTADHGLIDNPKDRRVLIRQHPEMKACLRMPLCGEPRAAYCYLKPGKRRAFEKYVREELEDACTLVESRKAIEEGYFGLFEQHPRLKERVGDYILLMKDDWIVKDFVRGEVQRIHKANHGGVSGTEMHVPLIAIR